MSAKASEIIPDGEISPDSVTGRMLGFTSDKFEGWLWKTSERCMISMIVSLDPGKGNLSKLFDAIECYGMKVAVPTPLGRMATILKRKGFTMHQEFDPQMGPCEVWERP